MKFSDLKNKSTDTKRSVALVAAGIVTFVLFIGWLTSLSVRFEGAVARDNDEPTPTSLLGSAFEGLRAASSELFSSPVDANGGEVIETEGYPTVIVEPES